MKTLVIVGSDINKFQKVGMGDENHPRLPLAYPFYGYLMKHDIDVELLHLNEKLPLIKYFQLVYLTKYISSFDVIISFGFIGAWLSILLSLFGANRKVLTLVYANVSGKLITNKIKDFIFNFGLRLCGKVIYMTREQQSQAINKLKFIQNQTCYLPVGVDTRFFNPVSIEKSLISPEILKLEKMSYIVVSGDQLRDEKYIAKFVKETGLKFVRLTQSKKIEEFWTEYKESNLNNFDVFCRANLNFHEIRYVYQNAFCLLNLVDNSWQPAGWTVMTEAMACGIPVIMNSGIVTRELKNYQVTLPIIEINNLTGLKETKRVLEKLSKDLSSLQYIKKTSREFVEKNLAIEVTGKYLIEIINSSVLK